MPRAQAIFTNAALHSPGLESERVSLRCIMIRAQCLRRARVGRRVRAQRSAVGLFNPLSLSYL